MPFLIILLLWIGLEAWLLRGLSDAFGGGVMLIWLLAAAVIGVLLIRRQGLRTVNELRASTNRGELPTVALMETMVVVVAGALLILPGLISDAIAIFLLLGVRKKIARKFGDGLAKARPDLKQPVTLEGEFRRKPDEALRR